MTDVGTELTDLAIDETSGVDSPANGIPGWMVCKTADDATRAESQLTSTYAALASADVFEKDSDEGKARQLILDSIEKALSPDKEPSAFDRLRKLFKKDPEDTTEKAKSKPKPKADAEDEEDAADGGADEDAEGEGSGEEEEPKGKKVKKEDETVVKAEDLDAMREALGAVLDRIEAVEKAVTGSAGLQGQEDDHVEKSEPTVRDGIMSAAQGNRVTFR